MDIVRPTRAKAYFDHIKSLPKPAEFLMGLIKSETPTFESEFLEFKGAHQIDPKSGDLTELWAKCLSCFANSDGGVLIFGIDAPKGAAKSLSLTQDILALRDRLKELVPTVTEPPVQRVEIEMYPGSEGSKSGFVVCHIPPSPWRPHQIRSQGQPGQFYIRATDNCIPCNHATLRSLFAPERVAVFEISYRTFTRRDDVLRRTDVMLATWLDNVGLVTASEVFVLCTFPFNHPPGVDSRLWEEAPTAREGKGILCKRSLHPGEKVQIFTVNLASTSDYTTKKPLKDEFTFRFSISARDQLPTSFELTVQLESSNDTALKKATLIETPI